MARTGLTNLIHKIRALCNVGTADYALVGGSGTVTYWTDDLLQNYLDRTRRTFRMIRLEPHSDFVDGDTTWTAYHLPIWAKNFEEYAADGSSGWRVYDETGTTIGTAEYSPNYEAGIITFSADQAGDLRYVDFRAYDLNRTAAYIWDAKAAHVAQNVTWSSDNHHIDAGQEVEHCLTMARRFRTLSGPIETRTVRIDE